MKIAVITDDGHTISAHLGRARHFLVYTVEGATIVKRELRDKAGHDDFSGEKHHRHDRLHGEGSDHDHDNDHHGGHDPRGHGLGRGAGRRHARMLSAIQDCDVLLARGMGQGAYIALQEANILPITSDLKSTDEAVQAYLAGEIVDRPERRH